MLPAKQFSRIAVVLIVFFVGLMKVEPAVHIISPVKNQIIYRNQSVLFNCTVTLASGANKFLWFINDTGKINATAKKETPYWSSFVLTKGLHAHEGEYRCIYGDIGSDRVTVYLAAKPTVGAIGQSSPVETEVDSRPTLSCYTAGWPTPSITWIRNNKILINQDNKYDITVPRDGYSELAIDAIQKKDEGFYTCMARNALGEDNYTFFVNVESAPKRPSPTISAERLQYTAVVGTDAMLVCHGEEVFDDPVTFLVWEFNGKEVNKSSDHYNITNDFYSIKVGSTPKVRTQLSILDVRYSDSGNYTCIVNSDRVVGLSDTIILEVKAKGDTLPHTSRWMIVAISVVTIILFLTLAVLIFVMCWRRKRKKKLAMLAQKYDQENHDVKDVVFVSYSTKDYDWVKQSLLPVFDQNGVEYVIHSRDFLPGKVWQENMADSVYNSKKVILVMSRNYLSSGSCKEEMWMALHKCTAKDDSSLILVRIDNIKSSDMPKSLRHRTFIDVTSLEEVGIWQRRILEYVRSDNRSESVTSDESLTDTRSLLSIFKMKRKKKKRDNNINVEKELENQA